MLLHENQKKIKKQTDCNELPLLCLFLFFNYDYVRLNMRLSYGSLVA